MLLGFLLFILPLAAAASLLLYLPVYLVNRRRYGKRPFLRHLVLYALIGAVLSFLYLTILWYGLDNLAVRPSYRFLNLRPFAWAAETYEMGPWKMAKQLMTNVAMLVPFGLLLPMAFPRLRRWWKTALWVAGFILCVETAQYFIGRSADVDDLIMNTLGGVLGYGLFALLDKRFHSAPWWRGALKADRLGFA